MNTTTTHWHAVIAVLAVAAVLAVVIRRGSPTPLPA